MARSQPRPTDAELAILRVLWERGASTVRQVHEALADTRETGYTTTLKLMQIMADKGLVKRNETARTHVYSADAGEEQTAAAARARISSIAHSADRRRSSCFAPSARKARPTPSSRKSAS